MQRTTGGEGSRGGCRSDVWGVQLTRVRVHNWGWNTDGIPLDSDLVGYDKGVFIGSFWSTHVELPIASSQV